MWSRQLIGSNNTKKLDRVRKFEERRITTSTHSVETLWREHATYFHYPPGVIPVPEPIAGTAFFPGGYGLWNPEAIRPLPPFPFRGVMIVGHDFHSESGYWSSHRRRSESSNQPTWRNLRDLLRRADIDLSECFFTNFFMGLRAGSATTGPFPGASDDRFVRDCRSFLLRQIEVQRPSLLITLGIQTPYLMAPLSPQLSSWGERHGLKHLDANEPVRLGVTFVDLPAFRTNIVAITHPSLRWASVRHRSYKGRKKDAAELLMLSEAYGARRDDQSL